MHHKTRITAVLTALLLSATLASGQEPIGTLVAWHKNLPGTPTLPDGWVECGGQTVNVPGSPYDGQTLPDLNNEGRFLRGNAVSGTLQDDAFQGHRHGVSHNAERVIGFPTIWGGGGTSIADDAPANVAVDDPINDTVNGDPRTAAETRPVNMSVVWILKAKAASMPLGAIVAWHQDFANTPALPPGWVPCDGQVLSDSGSPYDGQTLPNLNGPGDARLLRGGVTSGTMQDDAFQGHRHDVSHDAEKIISSSGPLGTGTGPFLDESIAGIQILDPTDDGTHGTPRTGSETRPVNMSVVWLIKVKASSSPVGAILGWHKDFANTPPAADIYRPCDGQVLADLMSPYDGQTLPDLNGEGRFLRGAGVSGTLQEDRFQGHRHGTIHEAETVAGGGAYGAAFPLDLVDDQPASVSILDPINDGSNGEPRTADETRPLNMSVVWVMTVKGPWDDMGNGLAGTTGIPELIGTGSMVDGELVTLDLTNILVGTTATLVYGTSAVFAPVKGGVLVPNPEIIAFGLPTFGGTLSLSVTWPSGVPGGLPTYWQYWILDPAGPQGFAASNGVRGTTVDL
jgi:hypothetical protein